MALPHLHRLTLALAILSLAQSAAFAEYVSITTFSDAQTAVGASVQIEAYDGNGAAGGGLSAGQVRLSFDAFVNSPPPPIPGFPGTFSYKYSGLSGVSFSTDLPILSPS